MTIRSAALAAAAAGLLGLGGCASIVSGQNQSVSVVSSHEEGADLAGARCSLVNDKGTWYATTPGSVTVRRSFNDLAVDCSADGGARGSVAVKSSTKPMAFGNILFGGVIGVGVDTVSGAAYDYPNVISVRMGRALDAAAGASAAARPPATSPPASPGVGPAAAAPGANAPTPPREHRKQVPAATGYALATDAASVPVRTEGKDRYLHYLSLPSPKAFVVYESGGWRFWSADADAMSKALDYCMREGRPCWLYAVDDRVVWSPDLDKRIGRSTQLADR